MDKFEREYMISYIVNKLRFRKHYKEWKTKNVHNHTEIQDFVPIDQVEIGRETYGMINVRFYDNKENCLRIGSFCSISENVYFVFGEHNYKRFSTFPFKHVILNEPEKEPSKGDITIQDDVWIGFNCTILSGVTIHQGAVIGAGSIVTKDVPPYAIYAGGKILGYRFSSDIIEELVKIDYTKVTKEFILKNKRTIYEQNITDFIKSNEYQTICRSVNSQN